MRSWGTPGDCSRATHAPSYASFQGTRGVLGTYLLPLPFPYIICTNLSMEMVFNMLFFLFFGRGDKKVICNKFIQTVKFRPVPGRLG